MAKTKSIVKVPLNTFEMVQEVIRFLTIFILLYLLYVTITCPCALMFSCHRVSIYVSLAVIALIMFINFVLPWSIY